MAATLKREGLFADGCSSTGGSLSDSTSASGSVHPAADDCASQTAALTQIYSVGTVVFGASGVLQGALIDRFGPRFGVANAGLCSFLGFYCFGCYVHDGALSPLMFSGAPKFLPMVGYILLALGGMAFFLTSFKMVLLLPPHRQGKQTSTVTAVTFSDVDVRGRAGGGGATTHTETHTLATFVGLAAAGLTTLGDASCCTGSIQFR